MVEFWPQFRHTGLKWTKIGLIASRLTRMRWVDGQKPNLRDPTACQANRGS